MSLLVFEVVDEVGAVGVVLADVVVVEGQLGKPPLPDEGVDGCGGGIGAAKSLFTLRSWWASGFEMTLAGVIVGGATYAVGLGFS